MRVTHTEAVTPEERFGIQVRDAREAIGWSQEALARHLRDASGLELHQTAIARLERGDRAIRLNEAAALASLLGLSMPVGGLPRLLDEETYESLRAQLDRLRKAEQDVAREVDRLHAEHGAQMSEAVQRHLRAMLSRSQVESLLDEYEQRQRG